MAPEAGPPLLTPRAAVVFLVAFIVGLLVGGLAHLGGASPSASAIASGGAFGATLMIANTVIGR